MEDNDSIDVVIEQVRCIQPLPGIVHPPESSDTLSLRWFPGWRTIDRTAEEALPSSVDTKSSSFSLVLVYPLYCCVPLSFAAMFCTKQRDVHHLSHFI